MQQPQGSESSDDGSASLQPSAPPDGDHIHLPQQNIESDKNIDEIRKQNMGMTVTNGRHPTSYADAVTNGSVLESPMTNLAMESPPLKHHHLEQHHQHISPSQVQPQHEHHQQVQVHLSHVNQHHQQYHEYHIQHHHYQQSQPHHDAYGYEASSSEYHASTGQPPTAAPPSDLPQCYPTPLDREKNINQLNQPDQNANQDGTAQNHYPNLSQLGGEDTKESVSNSDNNNRTNCGANLDTNNGMAVNNNYEEYDGANNDGRMSVVSERAMSIASDRAATPMAMSTVAEDDFMNQDVLYDETDTVGNHMKDETNGGGPNPPPATISRAATENQQYGQQPALMESNGVTTQQMNENSDGMAVETSASANPETSQGIDATHHVTNPVTNAPPVSNNPDGCGTANGIMGDQRGVGSIYSTPTVPVAMRQRPKSLSKELLRSPEHTIERLSYVLGRGTLVMINFSQRQLGFEDAELIRSAIISNPQLGVLKLGYNNFGDMGASLIASAINCGEGEFEDTEIAQSAEKSKPPSEGKRFFHQHHPSLSVLDLGFNNIGDKGCCSLAALAVSRNPALSTLYLSGNAVGEQGALSLAEAVAGGCGLTSLHLTANKIGAAGVKGLMRSIAEFDVIVQMAQQDRENRMALEEDKRRRKVEMNATAGNDDNVGDGVSSLDEVGQDEPDDLARLNGYKCMEELYMGGTNMGSIGCLSVSNMLLTNLSLRVLCLSDNSLNDQDLSLFSQSISRNRQLPIETLRLSFNRLTCVGVETLMNAIWESKTLREIKLDNNQIRDRGAQLAAVVLTSVDLEVLDLGFNRLTIVGVKALMKSLAENCSLKTLTLSGNVLDTNASKAVSYALAYNRTIRKLYVDHCSLSYAAQRHIAAGIVSNSNLALRVMSGFPLGAISVTLGLPAAMENWTNDQVLKFIRIMWDRHRHENEAAISPSKESSLSISSGGVSESSANPGAPKSSPKVEKVGPSDPATVVAAAKSAYAALGDAGGTLLMTEEPQRAISETSPIVSSDAVMLEKTPSGTVRVPPLDDSDDEGSQPGNAITPLDVSTTHVSTDSLCTANGKDCPETPMDPLTKKRNMEWLRLHYRSLNGMIQLPYVHADLLQLYRYFYSPVDADEEGSIQEENSVSNKADISANDESSGVMPRTIFTSENNPAKSPSQSSFGSPGAYTGRRQIMPGLQRKASYRSLHNAMMSSGSSNSHRSPNFGGIDNSCRRRPVSALEGCNPMQPALKRARNDKPRIDYFPRIKAKIEDFLSSSNQAKALVLLRQLKFVETTLFRGGNPYHDPSLRTDSNELMATDAEVILIDMM